MKDIFGNKKPVQIEVYRPELGQLFCIKRLSQPTQRHYKCKNALRRI